MHNINIEIDLKETKKKKQQNNNNFTCNSV